MNVQIQISGSFKMNNKTGNFTGTVTFEEREKSIYYSWTLRDGDGRNLAVKSMPLAFQQIPVGQDRFEFSKEHAFDGIRNYRIGREKIIQELSVLS